MSLVQIERSWFEDDLWSLQSPSLSQRGQTLASGCDIWTDSPPNSDQCDRLSDRRVTCTHCLHTPLQSPQSAIAYSVDR